MTKTAKIFKNGRSQAVRLPAEFRFKGEEVFIRKDEKTGDVILSEEKPKTGSWAEFFAMVREAGPLPDILTDIDRRDPPDEPERIPFADWKE